ncbi:hypothetical protein MHYP_G00087440 [Metynnis hypsauchen]
MTQFGSEHLAQNPQRDSTRSPRLRRGACLLCWRRAKRDSFDYMCLFRMSRADECQAISPVSSAFEVEFLTSMGIMVSVHANCPKDGRWAVLMVLYLDRDNHNDSQTSFIYRGLPEGQPSRFRTGHTLWLKRKALLLLISTKASLSLPAEG